MKSLTKNPNGNNINVLISYHASLGTIYLNSCPAQPYIPIYLIVLGVSSLLLLVLSYVQSPRKQGVVSILTSACTSLLHIFNTCWFVAGERIQKLVVIVIRDEDTNLSSAKSTLGFRDH